MTDLMNIMDKTKKLTKFGGIPITMSEDGYLQIPCIELFKEEEQLVIARCGANKAALYTNENWKKLRELYDEVPDDISVRKAKRYVFSTAGMADYRLNRKEKKGEVDCEFWLENYFEAEVNTYYYLAEENVEKFLASGYIIGDVTEK